MKKKLITCILCAIALALCANPIFAQPVAPPQEVVIGAGLPVAAPVAIAVSSPKIEAAAEVAVSVQKNAMRMNLLWLTFIAIVAYFALLEFKKVTKAIKGYCENCVTINGQLQEFSIHEPGEGAPAAAAAPAEKS